MENPTTWDKLTQDLSSWIDEWREGASRGIFGLSLPRFLRDRLVDNHYVLPATFTGEDPEEAQ